MTDVHPFIDSETLARWTATLLAKRDIDSLLMWRMLEQWMQSEIFRGIDCDGDVAWSHLGEGEQPYWSNLPKKPGKPDSIPRIDLVFAHPGCEVPTKIVWLELKHIGRNQKNLRSNSCGLGPDLVALFAIDPVKTKEIWLDPPPVVVNESKVEMWRRYGAHLDLAEHFYAQIVLVKREVADAPGNEEMIRAEWLNSFEKRSGRAADSLGIKVVRADTGNFSIFALLGQVGVSGISPVARYASAAVAPSHPVKAVPAHGFIRVKGLGIDRKGDNPGTPVKMSWSADGHRVEVHYKYKVGWQFDGFVLDGSFIPLPGSFDNRKLAEQFYLAAAYQHLQVP